MARRIRGTKAMAIRIKRLMDERNLRAAHLAEDMGVGRDYVGRWLKGGGIREDHVEALAELFDSTPAWIITGTGPMHLNEADGDVDEMGRRALADLEGRERGSARPAPRKRA